VSGTFSSASDLHAFVPFCRLNQHCHSIFSREASSISLEHLNFYTGLADTRGDGSVKTDWSDTLQAKERYGLPATPGS
uniref:Uncharacterized protein n=1 Tax=Mustela putorius furo TaxID=9669 RepID=M3YWA3_MUSPF